ncbi:MAG: hypothetical protein ACTHWO_02455 [Nesterenkonia sp.]
MSSTEFSDEEGSALIEFLALGLLLLLPAVWFLLAVAEVQASSYAAVGAADQAAKMHTTGDVDPGERAARSEAAVSAALADFGISAERAEISRQCSPSCEAEGALVGYTVEIRVPVPLIPEVAGLQHRLVTVSAHSAQVQGE